jgi:hypothetical protein
MKHHLLFMAVSAAVIMVPSASASICSDANDCTFTFDVHNVGPTTFGAGPYGTLNLQLVGNTIQATIDLADGFGLINTGFPNGGGTNYGFGFNENLAAADFSYSSYNPNTYNGGTTTAGTYQFDGFGDFDRAAANTDLANTGGANMVSFIITRTGGFNSVQNLVGQSSGNIYFAADVFYNGTNTPGSGCPTQSSCTGLIGVSEGGSPVPEPISSALVGTGLISLFFLRRRTDRRSTELV